MIIKSYIIEKNFNVLEKYSSVLFYGENNGLKIDIKNKIKINNKDCEIINLFEEEILRDESTLLNNLNNLSLFSKKKIIFLHEVSEKLFNTLLPILEKKKEDVSIFILSKALDKKSKLRSYFEKDQKLAIVPCYQDTEKTLQIYISEKLSSTRGVTPEIVNFIIKNSYMDRGIINNEIEKIKTFCLNNEKIEKEEIQNLLNIKNNESFEKLRDATLLGEKINVNILISEIQFQTEDLFFYINQLSLRLTKLLEIQNINENIKNYDESITQLKPKLFWKDIPIYIKQLKIWNIKDIMKAMNILGETELLMKKNSLIQNDIIIKNLLINICVRNFKSV
tara:strand:+ start:10693 stop:11700 length:1008 start_codon:yes stop_codon:yes gene_type:complete